MSESSESALKPRELQPGQRCEVWVLSVVTGSKERVYFTDQVLLEAPNWTMDGHALILNGDGKLWRLDLSGGEIQEIAITGIPDLNNDHVLAPDGWHIYASGNDGHIYHADLKGGHAARVTPDDGWFHFLHGVSPDGKTLAYVGMEAGDFTRPGQLMTMPAGGGPSSHVNTGQGHCDGPEYSPDGRWLYFNTESFSSVPGRAQIARQRVDGSDREQLVESETVDWFPHLSPDGTLATYLRFPAGTVGHPADLPVQVVAVSVEDWAAPVHVMDVFGGQGTLNVNSWSPDSSRFAYVAYPIIDNSKP